MAQSVSIIKTFNGDQTCKDLMKDLIKKEYSTYFGSDGRSETSSYGAEKFMLERKISPFPSDPFGNFAPC